MTAAPTPQQVQIAQAVNRRVAQVRPDLAHAHLKPEQVTTRMVPPALTPKDTRFIHGINDIFRTMPEAELGRVVRLAEKVYNRYLEASENPSAQLLHTALVGFQAAVVGMLRGGSISAQRSIHEAHGTFDRAVLLALNGEITVYRAEAEADVVQQRAALADLVEQAAQTAREGRQDMQRTLQQGQDKLNAERRAVQEDREMALAGLDQAQREASEARRQLEAASAQLTRERAAHGEELARLTEQLTRERTATVNRERTARNELHQVQNDLRTAQSVIANLNAECERLEAPSLTPVSTPLEVLPVTKQKTIKQMKCPTELGAMSLRAYLVAEGVENVQLDGRQVIWGKSIPLGVFEAWCGQYPTPAHQLAQLRAIALPILRRAA